MWTYKNISLNEGHNGFYLSFGSETHCIGDGVDTFTFDEYGYPTNAQDWLEELVDSGEVWAYFVCFLDDTEKIIETIRQGAEDLPELPDQYMDEYNKAINELNKAIDKIEQIISDVVTGREA